MLLFKEVQFLKLLYEYNYYKYKYTAMYNLFCFGTCYHFDLIHFNTKLLLKRCVIRIFITFLPCFNTYQIFYWFVTSSTHSIRWGICFLVHYNAGWNFHVVSGWWESCLRAGLSTLATTRNKRGLWTSHGGWSLFRWRIWFIRFSIFIPAKEGLWTLKVFMLKSHIS